MNIARRLINEGEERGEEKGEKKGKKDILMMLLQDKFGQLPAWTLDKLEKADLSKLETWCRAILRKNTLEEVLAF